MFFFLQIICSRMIRRLLRARLTNVCCRSRVGDKTITLTHEFIWGAREVQIECNIKWPLLLPALLPPATAIRLTGPNHRKLGEPGRCAIARGGRTTRIILVIPATALAGQDFFYLELVRRRSDQMVQTIAFHSLDFVKVARELRVECLDLFAQQAGQRIFCHRTHNEVERLGFNLKLTLDNPEHCSLLNQMGAELQVELVNVTGTPRRLGSWTKAVQFDGATFQWEQQMGKAKGLFANALGDHRLCLRFADALLASKPFPVITLNACVAEARNSVKQNAGLWDCSVKAVNQHQVAVPLDVVAEDFRQIKVSLMLEAPQPDPLLAEVELTLGIILRRAAIEVGRQSRNIIVKPGRHNFEDSLELVPEMFEQGAGRYSIEILLDDRSLKRLDFVHKTREQIKEAKAEEILRSLALRDPRLFALRDGKRVQTDHLFETDRAIAPAFCIEGRGFDEDAPVLQWWLGLKLVNLESGKSIQENQLILARAGPNTHNDLELPLRTDTRKLESGHYVLQLRKCREVLTEFKFCILALEAIVPYTRNIILQSLRLGETQMDVQAGTLRYQSTEVSDASDFLLPVITIHSAGYNAHLPQLETDLQLLLRDDRGHNQELASLPVTFGPGPLVLRNLAIKVRGGRLAGAPGWYCLLARIADRELTCGSFRLVAPADVIQAIRVSSVTIHVFTPSARSVENPPELNLDRHSAIRVTTGLEAGILAPNLDVEGALVLELNGNRVGHVEFTLRLDQARQEISTRRLNLAAFGLGACPRPRTLTVMVLVAGREQGQRSVTIRSAARLTNFEGQLNADPRQLEVDDAEYERILSRL